LSVAVVLADAELELAPRSRPPQVLESGRHAQLIRSMPEPGRRGRPDIVYDCLRVLTGSRQHREGRLDVIVHARRDVAISFDRHAPLGTYEEFLASMARLLSGQGVEGWHARSAGYADVIASLRPERVVVMSQFGREAPLKEELRGERVALVMGAFPCGDYASDVYSGADASVSLGPKLMKVPEVARLALGAMG